jgi:hypothetical protein
MHAGFESYRRERNRRRFDQGGHRQVGKNPTILRELEAAEQREARNQQLSREVHEFFEDATRTAANIVSQVTEIAESAHDQHISREMSEFLTDTFRRVQEFISLLQRTQNPNVAQTEVETNMHNLVGPKLDGFRWAGTAHTEDKHIGMDPFREPAEPDFGTGSQPDRDEDGTPAEANSGPAASIDDHLAAELVDGDDTTAAADPLTAWFDQSRRDPERLKATLKLLVRHEAMTKDEAQAIYRHSRAMS